MGPLLTRVTVWLAVTLFVSGQIVGRKGSGSGSRFLNTLGCAAFLAHVVCAFQFYHGWSHSAAYADTARRTAELFGWNSGVGLYINYLFGLVWLAEVLWSWTKPNAYTNRATWITWTVRGLFWFMIFNGAVVFAHGLMRWYGLLLCVALVFSWRPRPGA